MNFLHRIHRHFWIKSICKLSFKTALGTNISFNDFMRAFKSDVANSPKKIISSCKKCNMFGKFWMEPSAHNFDKFSSRKTCFLVGQEVASPSLSVVSHKRNLLISVSLEWHPVCCIFAITYVNSVLFPCLFPLHNNWFGVLVNADNMSKMNPVFPMIFNIDTITYTDK